MAHKKVIFNLNMNYFYPRNLIAIFMKYYLMKISIIVVAMLAFMNGNANQGQDIFNKTCAPCHTIGKGRLVGPDLKKINENRTQKWLIDFIKSSQSLIKSGDADAVAIYKEYNNLLMPDAPLNDGQVIAVLDYISESGSGKVVTENIEAAPDLLANVTMDDVSIGLKLFTGENRFANNGASCISCHKVKDDRVFSSGTMAKELTETHSVMGSAGVSAILGSPPFPAMSEAYKDKPLTEEEVFALNAYLKSVSDNHIYQHPVDFGFTFAIYGIIVFIMIFLTIIIFYFKRKRRSVNYKILRRQSAVIN